MKQWSFDLPLYVELGKKKIRRHWLNLNKYRNSHFQLLNKIKDAYEEIVIAIIRKEIKWMKASIKDAGGKVKITYVLHSARHRIDIANPLCIIDKFVCDALVKSGVLPDDDSTIIREVVFRAGSIGSKDPRCEFTIAVDG